MAAWATSKVEISYEDRIALGYEMYKRGYDNPHEYVMPPTTVQTDVPCPICDEPLPFYRAGNSYRIRCSTEGCIDVGVRGL